MDKSPEAFRTISEVADALDVPPHVLRFWETRFVQVKPVKRGGGRRYYRPEDVRLLRGIRGLLYDDGMTIKGVQKILRERGIRHVIGLGAAGEGEAPAHLPAAVTAPMPKPRAPKVAPAKAPVPATNGTGAHVPQGDLFPAGEGGATVATIAAPLERPAVVAAESGSKQLDKEALKALLAELEALRAVMTGKTKG
ncbi:MAG: MerR family transcriptional regulator [Amaricoccus sp.]